MGREVERLRDVDISLYEKAVNDPTLRDNAEKLRRIGVKRIFVRGWLHMDLPVAMISPICRGTWRFLRYMAFAPIQS